MEWRVRVEWSFADALSPDPVAGLTAALADHRSSVIGAPIQGAHSQAWQALVTVDARTQRSALESAVDLVRELGRGAERTAVVTDAVLVGWRLAEPVAAASTRSM